VKKQMQILFDDTDATIEAEEKMMYKTKLLPQKNGTKF